MDATPVSVTATLRARAGSELELRLLLLSLVAPSRLEPGCLRYELLQSADDPSSFIFWESWRSGADLERHLAGRHLKEVLQRIESLAIASPQVTVWSQIG